MLIYDVSGATPKLIYNLNDLRSLVHTLDFNHDGTLLAVGGRERRVLIYDMNNPTAAPKALRDANNSIQTVAFNDDGTRLAVGEWTKLRLYDIANLTTPLYTWNDTTNWYLSAAFSSDGNQLAAGGGEQKVWVYNVNNPGASPLILSVALNTGTT